MEPSAALFADLRSAVQSGHDDEVLRLCLAAAPLSDYWRSSGWEAFRCYARHAVEEPSFDPRAYAPSAYLPVFAGKRGDWFEHKRFPYTSREDSWHGKSKVWRYEDQRMQVILNYEWLAVIDEIALNPECPCPVRWRDLRRDYQRYEPRSCDGKSTPVIVFGWLRRKGKGLLWQTPGAEVDYFAAWVRNDNIAAHKPLLRKALLDLTLSNVYEWNKGPAFPVGSFTHAVNRPIGGYEP